MATDNIRDSIFGYVKNDSNIEVLTNKGKTIKVFNSEKNEKKLLNQIEKNRKKMIEDFEPDDSFMKISNEVTTSTGLLAIYLSFLIIAEVYKGTPNMAIDCYIALLFDSPIFVIGSLIYKEDKRNKKMVEKYKLFFENKEMLNMAIKKNINLLDNINSKAKKYIEENINNKSIPPLNINTIRKMKLKELKKLLEQAKLTSINDELDLETAEDIIDDNNLDKLTQKYDSIKKKELIRDNERLQI